MSKYMFKCPTCQTIMVIETNLSEDKIHKVPPCPCGISRMIDMSTPEYAYGQIKEYKFVKETNLGLEEIENPDECLCLDCIVSKDGL